MFSFVEAFWVMGVVFLLMVQFLLLLRYSKPVAEPAPAVTNSLCLSSPA